MGQTTPVQPAPVMLNSKLKVILTLYLG
jgi:hypothetical protein